MKDICATCLATDRRLKLLKKSGVFDVLEYLLVQIGYNELRATNKVCWECIAQLNNVRKFQNKALDSLRRLQEYSNKSEIHNEFENNPQTTLSIQNVININIHDNLNNSKEECKKDSVQLDDNDDTEAQMKVEECEDEMFVENDLGIPVNTDPLSIVELEYAMLDDESADEINNGNGVQDNLQIRVKDFANINQRTIINKNDKSTVNYDTPNTDLISLRPIIREAELSKICSSIKTYKKRTDNEVTEESLLKKNENLACTRSDGNMEIDESNSNKLLPKKINKSTKICFKNSPKNNKFTCDICKREYNDKFKLAEHIAIHNKYSINSIFKKEPLVSHIGEENVKAQIQSCTTVKPFKCHLCEYRAKQKCDLRSHVRIHTGEKPFECHLCEYKTIQKTCLIYHIRTHTGEKPFKCNFCEYRARCNSHLKNHVRTHTGEKPFKCHLCEYKAKHKSNLMSHIRTHTGVK